MLKSTGSADNMDIDEKDFKQYRHQMEIAMETKILYGDHPDTSYQFWKMQVPIAKMLSHPFGDVALSTLIRKYVLPHLTSHDKILNTNIPEVVYKKAGLEVHQYVKTDIQFDPKPMARPAKKAGKKIR